MSPLNNQPESVSRFLSAQELMQLTGKKAASAQRRALDLMRVPFITRPDGKPVVSAGTFIGGSKKQATPNWGAV